jgi:ABC-type glycerol-3-phosphate transport system substrate-binding protein
MGSKSRLRAATFVALAVALVMSACAAEEEAAPEEPEEAAVTTAAPEAAPAADADACDEIITLRMLRWQGDTLDIAIEDYKAVEPCVEIAVEEVPFGQLYEKISIVATSDDPPDLLLYDGPFTQSYAEAGMLLPLDDYITEEHLNDILIATRSEHSYQGRLYSPGLEQSAMALFYNKDMTDAAGIDPPQELSEAWTWEEAVEAFRKIQDEGIAEWGVAPSAFGDGTPGFAYRDLIMARSMGDPDAPKDSSAYRTYWSISEDGCTVDGYLNTPEAIEGLEFYAQMFDEWEITPKVGIPNALLDGTAAFGLEPPFVAGVLEANADFEWGIAPLPYFNTPFTHTGSVTIGVSAKTKYPDEAAAFVMFATNPEQSKKYSDNYKSLPVRQSILDQQTFFDEYPQSIFADSLAQSGQPRPPTPAFTQYEQVVTTALSDIALGADAQETMDRAVAELDPILARYCG